MTASIIGDILGGLYAVVTSIVVDHERCRKAFMTRLNKWLGKLNDDLRCDLSQDKPVPKPCVLILHLWYWSTVVLVNRDLYVFPFLVSTVQVFTFYFIFESASRLRQEIGSVMSLLK